MKISVIIPTFQEAENIAQLVTFLKTNGGNALEEVIVADAGSSDNTINQAESAGAKTVSVNKRSRAAQMNAGAHIAQGELLYFVHADVKLLTTFSEDILHAVKAGYTAGCYRYQFDSNSKILRANAYFTRFNRIMCRGGDQTLFITKQAFESLGGFNERFVIMEDYDLIERIQKTYRFYIIPKSIRVSARKYLTNSWFRVQVANLTIFILYFLKADPSRMARLYKRLLNYR
jgi:rSAM/selenodomain-associated transferase 2